MAPATFISFQTRSNSREILMKLYGTEESEEQVKRSRRKGKDLKTRRCLLPLSNPSIYGSYIRNK